MKYKFLIALVFIIACGLFFQLPTSHFPLPITFAQTQTCGTGTSNTRATGLVSTPNLATGSKFKTTTTGACIIDPKTAFVPFKIPTFDDLKSIYFDQSKLPKSGQNPKLYTLGDNPSSAIDLNNQDKVYFVDGNLTIDNPSDISGNQTGVIFVKGHLTIGPISGDKLQHGNANSGLVFVVKGNINIDPSLTGIDAVLISEGTIYTAGSNCNTNSVSANQLVINGSLISLKQPPITDPNAVYIKFCRTLPGSQNATLAAEKINHQAKYTVVLRHIMSDTLQRWSEIP